MTDECQVPRCGQPKPKHAFVCNDCRRVLKQDLASVPGLVGDLLTTIARLDVLGGSGGRRGAETAVPWKDHASQVLWDLNSTMVLWTRIMLDHYQLSSDVVAKAYDGHPVHQRVTASAARWLLAQVDSLVMRDDAGQVVDEVAVAVERAYRAIDRVADKLPAGQCGDRDCPAYLYVDPHAETVECPKCGAVHDMAERHAWMSNAAQEHRVTATEAYGWVKMLLGKDLPDSTWRRWLTQPTRGGDEPRLPHDDVDHVGRKLYRWGDVVEVVRQWVAQPKSTRGQAA